MFKGDESASYAPSDDATSDILLSILMRFGLVLKRRLLRRVQYFRAGRWIRLGLHFSSDVRGMSLEKKRMEEYA